MKDKHPDLARIIDQEEVNTQQRIQQMSAQRTQFVVYTIPIVFHILHQYGQENISDAQVIDAVRILNNDYNLLNADTANLVPEWQGRAANVQFTFVLATIDPNGNCTNGIDRIVTPETNIGDDNSKLNQWPRNKYLNVWTAANLDNGAAGYSYYPSATTFDPGIDGIMILSGYVGSIGTGSGGRSRALTHEIGHYLNLAHPWGSTNQPGVSCGGSDNVGDTPETMGFTTCALGASAICNPPVVENVQNYMDYSYCSVMFTNGQKTRMISALTSSTASRNNLWSAANITATGTGGGAAPLCAPTADLSASYTFICEGDSIVYNDLSWNGQPSSWSWSFPGGTPATSSDSDPVVHYNTAGVYTATLTSSNATGSSSKTRTNYILVATAVQNIIPYAEGFEATTFPPANSYSLNPNADIAWARVTTAHSSGVASMKMNNFSGNGAGRVDEFITPAYDFTNVVSPVFTFKLANSQRNSTSADALKIYYSVNCGQSWTQRYSKSGAALATTSIHSSAFTPASADWRTETVPMSPIVGRSNVRFKFQSVSGAGNNLYVDDININGLFTGIDDAQELNTSFSVYPNPSSGIINIDAHLDKSGILLIEIYDLVGKKISTVVNNQVAEGDVHYSFGDKLQNGVYFVKISTEGKSLSKKIVIID
jgi:PKD repeat protein